MTKPLAVFDIDGTLTDTYGVDDDSYCEVVAEAIGVPRASIDWSGAQHVTDAEIFKYLCASNGRPLPTPEAMTAARDRFVERLREAHAKEPARFAQIPGARAALDGLRSAGWATALATGGWGASARFKLLAAGLEIDDALLACADDGVSRADIVRVSIGRAERHYGARFDRIVLLGDGEWDVRAARELRLPFVGIGSGDRGRRLHTLGASVVLEDYRDRDELFRALRAATVPVPRVH